MTGIYRSEAGAREIAQQYRALLDKWPVEAEERRVPTSQGETFVVVSGPEDAPPLVALQGSGRTRRCGCRRSRHWPSTAGSTPST